MKLLVILLTGIILEKTVVQSELTCDGHDLRTMMVQLRTLRQEFADFKLKSEKVIRIQNEAFLERQTQYENVIQVLNNTIRETLTNATRYESAIKVLNDTIRETLTNHTKYENIIQKLNNTVQRMNETIQETLRNYTTSNEVIQSRLSKTIHGLNDNVQVQETFINQTKSDKITKDLNTAMQETLRNHTAELMALKGPSPEKLVGFIATSQNDSVCNGILTFETTVANNGSAYNSSDGYFTAPYEGIYLFSVQLCFDNNYNYYQRYNARFQIYSPTRNQFITATQYASYHYSISCTSLTTTAYLSKYDQIYLNCTSFGNITRSNDIDYWNMLTGVLIKADG